MSKEKREIIIEFLKKNPTATYKEIRKETKLHPERLFKGGLKEAYNKAEIKPPRTFDKKTKEEKRKIIINYIKKNPTAGGHTIKKDTKINFQTIFKTTKELYESAGINYPRDVNKINKKQKREEILNMLRKNPESTCEDIIKKIDINPYMIFKNLKEAYDIIGIKELKNFEKRMIKKQKIVMEFIKNNNFVTQREINKSCKTHVQSIFKGGIMEAYKKARINYPYERRKFHGVVLKKIKEKAKMFEDEVAIKLSGYGRVNRLVKTKRGFADIILEIKNKKIIIEVKDNNNKEISLSEVKQLNKYLEDLNCNLGILICRKKPKKDKFLIDKNKIFILDISEIKEISGLITGL